MILISFSNKQCDAGKAAAKAGEGCSTNSGNPSGEYFKVFKKSSRIFILGILFF